MNVDGDGWWSQIKCHKIPHFVCLQFQIGTITAMENESLPAYPQSASNQSSTQNTQHHQHLLSLGNTNPVTTSSANIVLRLINIPPIPVDRPTASQPPLMVVHPLL